MARLMTFFTKGKGFLTPEGLRCGAPRELDPARNCNKLVVKKNKEGQIAGNFRCERCRQEIEVRMGVAIAIAA
jgi:hypothetical protein